MSNSVRAVWSNRVIQVGRAVALLLREREFWGLVVASIVLVVLAYQVPFDFALDLGSPFATPLDEPFLVHFYPAEHGTIGTYRWTRKRSAIVLNGVGTGTPLRLKIRALTLRPEDAPPANTRVLLEGKPLAKFKQPSDWKDYVIVIPADRNPDRLEIELKTVPFQQEGGARNLGIVISRIQIAQAGVWTPTMPSPRQVILFVLMAIGLYVSLRRLGFAARGTFLIGLVVLLGASALVAFARPFYGVFSSNLATLVALNVALAFVLPFLGRRFFQRAGIRFGAHEACWLWLLVLIGFNVRWVAELYPTTMFGDSIFHLHRLDATAAGNVLFTSAAGAIGFEQTIPYPPALYLVLTPLTTLFANHLALLKTFVSLTDALGAVLIYFMVRVSTERARPALLSAGLYLFLPIAILNFAWAIYANLLAESALVLVMAVWLAQSRRISAAGLGVMGFVLVLAFLSHVTAPLLLIGFAGLAVPLFWFGFKSARRALVLRPLLVIGFALVVVFALYYVEFVPLVTQGAGNVISTRATRGGPDAPLAIVGGGVKYPTIGLVRTNVYSLQEWVSAGAIGLAREAWVYFAVWPLVLAPFGFYLVARQERGRRLAVLGAAGLGAGIVFALIGVVADMHVRYPLFLLPFVAMGCGIVLDVLWERGRWARIVVIGLLMLTLLFSASLWKFFI